MLSVIGVALYHSEVLFKIWPF